MTRRFIDGPFCLRGSSGAEPRNCERCREESAAGDAFRQGLARGLALPVVADGDPVHRFTCPVERGAKPWGWKTTRQSRPAPTAPAPPKSVAVPRDRWPLAARVLERTKRDGERGIGDTVKRLVGNVGGELFKRWYKRITGEDCGCGDRQARLNRKYPYATGESPAG